MPVSSPSAVFELANYIFDRIEVPAKARVDLLKNDLRELFMTKIFLKIRF